MKKLWQKDKYGLDPTIEAFETEGDLKMDQKLVKYDCLGSLAHAKMLKKIGIISESELSQIEKGLNEILKLDSQGECILEKEDEDMHTKIENFLTDKYGEVGKKIHTARSRNDQVLTALRLYCKAELENIQQAENRLHGQKGLLVWLLQQKNYIVEGLTEKDERVKLAKDLCLENALLD